MIFCKTLLSTEMHYITSRRLHLISEKKKRNFTYLIAKKTGGLNAANLHKSKRINERIKLCKKKCVY